MSNPTTALRWHGGKFFLAKHIIALMPYHTRYAEAFFGGGSVLLQKPFENVAEYANDVNSTLTKFWSVLADDIAFKEFYRRIEATPFSKPRFLEAVDNLTTPISDSEVNIAVEFFIANRQSRQGLGKDFATPTTRLRKGLNEQVSAWLSAVDGLPELHARLRRVEIWNCEAIEFIDKLDKSNDTCHYLDPPYLHETRTATDAYQYEMTTEQHVALLDYLLRGMIGKVILSGYPSELYQEKLKGWRYCDIEIDNKSSSSSVKEMKVERIWMNYK